MQILGLTFDPTISLGTIGAVASILGAGAVAFSKWTTKQIVMHSQNQTRFQSLEARADGIETAVAQSLGEMKTDVREIRGDIRSLNERLSGAQAWRR